MVQKYAGMLIKDEAVKTELVDAVISLSKNEILQQQLMENIGKLGIKHADEIIAKKNFRNNIGAFCEYKILVGYERRGVRVWGTSE